MCISLQDCISLADALQEHGSGSPAVRRAAQAMTAARRPAALAAARLAAYTATPKDPLSCALSELRFHALLACSSSLGSPELLPWEVMLSYPSQTYLMQSCYTLHCVCCLSVLSDCAHGSILASACEH